MNEQQKYELIKDLVERKRNKKHVALKLNLSVKQVNRLIIKYKEIGKSGFVHGNRSRKPPNALDKSISKSIILLYTTKYQDFNFKHFSEYLNEKENINYSVFLTIL